MAQFIAIDPQAEVNGQTVLSVVSGMLMESFARGILKDNGIDDPQPDKWYPQQAWLNSFKAIADKVGDATLNMIGKQIPHKAAWPPEVNNLEMALASVDVAYHMNHRIKGEVLFDPRAGSVKEGIGHYNYQSLGERKGMMTCDNPYPCDFDMGIIEGVYEKFKPGDSSSVAIIHDDSGECRKRGSSVCRYLISW